MYPPFKALSSKTTDKYQAENINTTAKDALPIAIVKTIEIIEASGNPDCENKKGLSGEIGCHQYMPSTWSSYSKDVFGEVREQTKENAYLVTFAKVKSWLDQGLTPREIFLIWNTGHNGKCSSGINRYGVRFDSCSYVEDALIELEKVIHN